MKKNIIGAFVIAALAVICANIAYATVEFDSASFDPAVIAAGDEVDITINFHDDAFSATFAQYKDTALKVFLEPADTISEKYLIITDATGSSNVGHLFAQGVWRKTFRVKVNNEAAAAKYKLRARFQYLVGDEPIAAGTVKDFYMDVKKEGIILGIANIVTVPSVVRPGDDFVELTSYIENSGNKNAKSIEAILELPSGLEHSYTDNNRLWVGTLDANESKKATFFLNVDENAASKKSNLELTLNYMDADNNRYSKKVVVPFLVKEKPNIEVVDVKGQGNAGSKIVLEVTLKNTGTEDAEAVDARLIKQSSQPFSFDLRSNYIGELKQNETGKAVFKVKIDSDAELKQHFLKMLIRAKGDSDKGDEDIYTFNRRAIIKVEGKSPNRLIGIGIIAIVIVIGFGIFKILKKRR